MTSDHRSAEIATLAAGPSHHVRIFRSDRLLSQRAWADFTAGASLWRLWLMLGWLDIRQRYRRALIGPFWITISMAVMVGSMGLLYSSLFGLAVNQFIPFLAAGFCVWFLISSTLTDATTLFVQAETIIRNANVPIATHIYRVLWRNLIVFGHNILVMPVIYAYFGFNPGLPAFLALAGVVLVLANLGAAALLVASICTRFRDAPPIVSNLIQITFFLSPVMYKPELLKGRLTAFAEWNPFYYMLEVIRAPLLGSVPPAGHYAALVVITLIDCSIAFLFYRRFRSRIAYWL